jgi:hypothetical protein
VDNTDATTIIGAYGTWLRDDAVSNAHAALTVRDCFFETYMGISWRNTGGGSGTPFRLVVADSVFHIRPMPCESGAREEWIRNGQGSGSFLKYDGFRGKGGTVRDTVVRVDLLNRDLGASERWPADLTYENVTVVWTGPGAYLPVPRGVTVTTDLAVYDRAKEAVLSRNGWTT